MSESNYDVIILGMGPVGAFACILLSRAGLSVAVIEQDIEVYKLPRAVNLDGEIVRALQPARLAEACNALLQPVRPGERAGFGNSKREWLFGSVSTDFGVNGWQTLNMFDQPELEIFLRETALTHSGVTSFIGHTATQSRQDESAVTVTIDKNGQQQQIVGTYLLACDGASSPTRKALDIAWQDLGYDHDWLVVDVITKPGHTLDHTTMQVCSPDRIATYVCTKDPYRRWEFKLNEGETWEEMLEPDKIKELISPWTPPDTVEIRRAAMYQFHAATAQTWQEKRIFICGDAAHQTPPFLGQGMNTGMRDAINFAWKLPLVVNGVATAKLLESYQSERLAHAHDMVEWAVSVGKLMEHLAAVEAAERAGQTPPDTPESLQAAGYGQGREQPPLRTGVLLENQVEQPGITGNLLTQPIVKQGEQNIHMDQLLGPGFAVVTRSKADLNLSAHSRNILSAIGAQTLCLDDVTVVKGHIDRGFKQVSAMIIRPDRYIFGHTSHHTTLDQLINSLAEKLCLTNIVGE